MKKSLLIVGLSISLVTCTKKEQPVIGPVETLSENVKPAWSAGVTVHEGRLNFTFDAFKQAIAADLKEEKVLFEHTSKLEGFTPVKVTKTNPGSRSACNCPTDDEFVNEIVDEHYMFEIEEWTVKVDNCQEKFYAIYTPGFGAAELPDALSNLENCTYLEREYIFVWTFDDELLDQITLKDAELENYDPPVELVGCGDHASDDRQDVAWEDPNFVCLGHGGSWAMPIGRLYLNYDKRTFKGHTSLFMEKQNTSGTIPWYDWNWLFEDCDYRERCGDLFTRDMGTLDVDTDDLIWHTNGDWSGYYEWVEYHGNRLKAAEGRVKLRAQSTLGCTYTTDMLEIVF